MAPHWTRGYSAEIIRKGMKIPPPSQDEAVEPVYTILQRTVDPVTMGPTDWTWAGEWYADWLDALAAYELVEDQVAHGSIVSCLLIEVETLGIYPQPTATESLSSGQFRVREARSKAYLRDTLGLSLNQSWDGWGAYYAITQNRRCLDAVQPLLRTLTAPVSVGEEETYGGEAGAA